MPLIVTNFNLKCPSKLKRIITHKSGLRIFTREEKIYHQQTLRFNLLLATMKVKIKRQSVAGKYAPLNM